MRGRRLVPGALGQAGLVLGLALGVVPACATAPAAGPASAAAVSELAEVQAVVARVSHYIDAKRWDELRALFADEVATDYTSLFGGTPQRPKGDDLIAGWRTVLARVTTQHLLGPIDATITGTTARAECHVRGAHHADVPGGSEWVVAGHYVFALEKRGGAWRITSMTLQTLQQTGNAKLLEEAAR